MRFQCPGCQAINVIDPGDEGIDFACGRCQQTLHAPESGAAPQVVFGDFLLHETLVKRSHETDFRATQLSLNRPAVVKLIDPELCKNERFVKDFLEAARNNARLCHPNICPVYAMGRENDMYYLAREDSGSMTLKQDLIGNGVMVWKEALDVIRDMAAALDYARKDQKLTHFNLKPDYILVCKDRPSKLCDIGLAGLNPGEDGDRIVGTPQYLAPERIVGMEGDHRSDLYSLGVSFFFMITGDFPFAAETTDQIISKHLQELPQAANQLVPDIPPHVCSIIDMLLEKNPNERYQTGRMLIEDLEAVKHGTSPVHAMKSGKLTPQSKSNASVDTSLKPGTLKVRTGDGDERNASLRNNVGADHSTVIKVAKAEPTPSITKSKPAEAIPKNPSSGGDIDGPDMKVAFHVESSAAAPVPEFTARVVDDDDDNKPIKLKVATPNKKSHPSPITASGKHDVKQPLPVLDAEDMSEDDHDDDGDSGEAADTDQKKVPVQEADLSAKRQKLAKMLKSPKRKTFRRTRTFTRRGNTQTGIRPTSPDPGEDA